MISSVSIHNFKAFRDVVQPIAPLTILTGLNGRGKSSFVQSILLAWSTLQQRNPYICLNNEYIILKSVSDAFSWYHEDNTLRVGMCINEYQYDFASVPIHPEMAADDSIKLDSKSLEYDVSPVLNMNLHYLSTWRMGNMQNFPIAPAEQVKTRVFSAQYGDGKLTPRFLEVCGNEPIPVPALSRTEDEPNTLFAQVNDWLKVVSPDLNLKIEKGNSEMRVRYYPVGTKGIPTLLADAVNVGFGITYALPVITAVLASKPGDVVIIETPEAHIHPAGQARLMDLITLAAESGIQVILETHSDHIIHGLLRNIKSGRLSVANASVLFFDKSESEADGGAVVSALQCTKQGRIKGSPKGFFDQYMIDMKELL